MKKEKVYNLRELQECWRQLRQARSVQDGRRLKRTINNLTNG